MENEVILSLEHISKEFPGVKALDDVKLKLRKGEVHALMGENGAGKSTMIKVMTGVYPKTSGTIVLNNQEIEPQTPQEAQETGISTVYQEINLCPNLTVAENIYIGRQPKKLGKIDWKKMNEDAKKLLETLKIDVDVTQTLDSYSVSVQQMIAIARAVDMSAGVLILDEPTSSLDGNEVEQLFEIIRELKNNGMAILFVTHFLDQVYAISDRITVLRNGRWIGEYPANELSQIDLVTKMIGQEFKDEDSRAFRKTTDYPQTSFIQMRNVTKKGVINDFSMKIREGEVLGLAGLLGSGRSEVAELLFGAQEFDEGVLYIDNDHIKKMFPQKAIKENIGFCSEDRKVSGILADLSIRENIIVSLQAKRGWKRIGYKEQQEIAERYIKLLNIKTPDADKKVGELSGGNQQKVLLARWLVTDPKLLILDEPTRGIDIGSKREIESLILSLSRKGMSILFISSEYEEMVRCCDRIIVLRDRLSVAELVEEQISENNIMSAIAGEVS
ncbi:sugar ABC transporter ATP-binding protein [Enterococcus hulanensis]|uniref:Sugar ABC transporter ATP-binding protein n=1 Tax=Enterococcus hulanensis TaxID=2559929 RepID=A0ABU3F5G2_9ENTE|nr:sugar ABC transporter ATP-binding protein [Enterococcus hulanensis]MBO0457380.1 sugar ABC transporter ATP-binding protein [Enterococcus hulanensis]MDT2602181.1 sugar ABC transporter ATP-binding protein [Enterococcus hulanensis]MDT2611576.1 sugar ABC transporter ATP-binding protein [Enterococcus hulanensis]MDT2618845.1 sugar ABC transporter ATP-binding protein [Enterococcus hulanensis]MDT2630253.1 sugar ABC transporter ATP-binding protein [Enterococcus hulanensis]